MKFLFYGESPCNETGAARVNRYLLDTLVESGHQVQVLATSHFFEDQYDHARYPYPIESISREDPNETHRAAGEALDGMSFDWLFISQDMHVPQILREQVKKYPSIVLAAIDGGVRFPQMVDSLLEADIPAVYSRYSYGQVIGVLPQLAGILQCIPLGCEPDVFFPISEEERREYRQRVFGVGDETFLVMWANRNQMRKDPGRALYGFHLFHEQMPNSRLYMHCRMQDVGGDVVAQAKLLGLRVHGADPEVIFAPPEYTEIAGFDRDKLNRMYNAADVVISSSRGEGWGLTTSEAMAAGRPFIGPANTTFFEMLGAAPTSSIRPYVVGERGLLVHCGGDELWEIFYGRDDAPRPLISCQGLAMALEHVYRHPEAAHERGQLARQWAERHTWEAFKEQWKGILTTLPSFAGMGK